MSVSAKISATIITLNEEPNLARAVRSLRFCDEVVVVDSGSTDGTRELARSLGARVVENDWPGYARQKNYAAETAEHDWILSIDADEEVSAELAEEISALKRRGLGGAGPGGYDFPRLARYQGRWIGHSGWYPDRKVRFYDKRSGAWVGDYVHESVAVSGPVGSLRSDLLHYTCDSPAEHLRTLERYTDLAAREIHDAGRRVSLWRLSVSPPAAFVRAYFVKFGFLDGVAGLRIAWLAAVYVLKKYSKARSYSKARGLEAGR